MKKTNHSRILKIGNKLVEGPSAIFFISEGDWLEKELQITFYEPGMRKIESYSIWSDDSMNKEKKFHAPMIRILKWNRKNDLDDLKNNSIRKFPKIEVELGRIKEIRFEEANEKFILLQKSVIENNRYIPYKISTERDSAQIEMNYEEEYLDYLIYFRNGVQSIQFSSTGNTNEKLVNQLIEMKNFLISSIDKIDKSEWKERYYELTEEYLEGEIPEWYYDNIIRSSKSKI
jgi:hypothetical protein